MSQLRPWQGPAVEHLLKVLDRNGAAADLSEGGTGKTWVATTIAKRLNRGTLVICPKALIPAWGRVAEAIGTEFDVINYEKLRTGRTPFYTGSKWHPGVEFTIWDEVHRCSGLDTHNAEMLTRTKDQGIRSLLLSATLADSPLKLKAAGYALGLHDGADPKDTLAAFTRKRSSAQSFSQWMRKYNCKYTPGSGYVFGGSRDEQIAQMAKIHATIFPDRGYRVRIADLGDLFPETQITAELYDISAKDYVNSLYAQMRSAIDVLHARKAGDRGGAFTELLRARQEIELLKVPIFVELAQDAAAQGQHVAIFVNFLQTLNEICARLGTFCRVDGTQTGDKGAIIRQRCIDDFQEGRSPYIGCISEAGGVGLSLHGENRLALISPGFRADIFQQVLYRVRRTGGQKSIQRAICLAGTVEEQVAHNLTHKLDRLDALNDADFMP